MFRKYFKDIDRNEAIKLLEQEDYTGFIVRPCSNKSDDDLSTTIQKEDGDQSSPSYYSLSFITENSIIKHLKFKSFELDVDKLDDKFSAFLEVLSSRYPFLTKPVLRKKNNFSNCELIHVHRNLKLSADEIAKSTHILGNKELKDGGVLIISTQTPERSKKELKKSGSKAGKTGLELQSILSGGKFAQKWVIITGHGNVGATSLTGAYTPLFQTTGSQTDLYLDPKDFVSLLMQSGLKAGDNINIILYVCYGGAREETHKIVNRKMLTSTIPGTSFAEKLAAELALYDISSIIVASKTSVLRFNGTYLSDEKPGLSMKFRMKDGPSALRIVCGELHGDCAETNMVKEFTSDFIMSKDGIGLADNLNADLREYFQTSATPSSKRS